LYYFHKKLKIKNKTKNPQKKHFLWVFLCGFLGGFLGGFFVANPGHLAEDVDNCGGHIVDFAEEDDQILEKDPSGGEDGR
jgi:hypothetical protein